MEGAPERFPRSWRPATQIETQRTALAEWTRAAVALTESDDERMVLVEENGVGWKMRLHEGADVFVSCVWRNDPVAGQHSARVSIGDEERTAGSVEKNRIHGLGPEARHVQKLTSERDERSPTHAREAPAETPDEPLREGAQSPRFQSVRSGRSDHGSELGLRQCGEAMRREQATGPERGHGARGIRPGRVLRQHRTDGDLERRSARPPVLRAEPPLERAIEPQEARFRPVARRTGNPSPARQHRAR